MNNNILVVLPDGVGLKNFGFSSFVSLLDKKNINVTFWNSTPFNLDDLNFKSLILSNAIPVKTDILKRAKVDLELDYFSAKFDNQVYKTYKFPIKYKGFKSFIKNQLVNFYKIKYKGKINKIQKAINNSVMGSTYYYDALKTIEEEKPSLIFCTNQRASNAIAPILAAKYLNILTACFIFSWDNLPKATKIIDTDYYFVWSDFMKNELLTYYPLIKGNQVKVVGTPQFEFHFELYTQQKQAFYKNYNLSYQTKYILFSGDDITTSPKDEQFLEAICKAVKTLNQDSRQSYGVLFRPCPVDFSDRYDQVLNEHATILTKLQPYWEKQGSSWNTVLPTKADAVLLANTINASSIVVNLGSSMVFDAAVHNKPTAYINFNPSGIASKDWSVKKIYNFIHFQSMPNKDAVIWINDKEEIVDKILEGLNNPKPYVENAQQWFEAINQHPPEEASERIVDAIGKITNKDAF